ncbi:MAG: LON peptidase substrate-binding domain-containing protein [Chloroflexota bacterium]
MMDLPLFPLNTVLFPGMPLSLHIFEERYKAMINACISEKMPFGVVLIAEGAEANGPLAAPYEYGCTAQITQVQPLVQGRMNLVAVGQDRFRIIEVDRDSQPYLVGKVEMAPMKDSSPATLQKQGEKLYDHVLRYLEILTQAGDVQFDPDQLPKDAMPLANLAAFLVRVDSDKKQLLLEAETTSKFVAGVRALYSTENALLETMLKASDEDDGNPATFSLN